MTSVAVASAAADSTNDVELVTDATVAPAGIPEPDTVVPALNWDVSSQVTVVFVFVVSHVLFSHVIVIELSLSTAQCILKPTPYNSPVTIELPLLTF